MEWLVIYHTGNPNSIGTACVWSKLCASKKEAETVAAKGFCISILFSPKGWEKTKSGDYKSLTTGCLTIL